MKVEECIRVAHPPERVWAYFGQIAEVTQCMPGASLREPATDGEVKFQLDVKLGPMRAAFVGDAEVERDDASRRGIIRGSGRDTRSGSRAKGEVRYVLSGSDDGAATQVDVSVDFSLAGSLAQFSRGGIVSALAARLAQEFARNLQGRLDALDAPAESPAAGAASSRPAELHAGRMVLGVLWARIRRFFSRLAGRG
ncbi:MAG: SRPBCC family protein [Gammaproteobacteria bacterium]|nr:SRPBCC family protein [Gammaproteobacteria bacterium]NIR84388.1 SRPBCC family protein [Gammaproteobacteria bacterium]NIR90869.1 SRPBCC family protein [Gammaproteobacteria bacterium]NIU07055.1 SRPBCC family protein [Gammaproteobacteria bacterium]NIV76184.1 carbon monoxide dehydrogenase [Gammaproteobacteria bacterium]